MAFPENILTDDEHIAMHLHPHWREMVRPMLVFLLSVGAVVAAWVLLPDTEAVRIGLYVLAGLALILVLWLSVWPWIVWRTTHYVFTNERVILQHGVFRRERRDIPLHRVNDHSMSQTLVDRLFGCGTLIIESAGERGQTTLIDVPKVQRVQTLLYDLVDRDRDKHALGDDEFREILREYADGELGSEGKASAG
ncbi:MAG TPA: PH domain-containing protein [Natronosporangium sp.]|nr:PH domain-containing protein [Natronosporangium sp.]